MDGLTKLQKLAIDVYDGKVEKYSQEDGEQALRKAMLDVIGCMPTEKKRFRRAFNKHKDEFFEIVEQLITVSINRMSKDSYDFADFKTTDLGVKPLFKVENSQLFKVSTIANGLNTIRRQRIYNATVETTAVRLAIKIYDEFYDFITGRRDWRATVDRVIDSFNTKLGLMIGNAVFGAYDLVETRGLGVASKYDEATLFQQVLKVEGVLGQKCAIYGTATALDNIKGEEGDLDKADRRNFGFVKMFKGRECIELPQAYDLQGEKFLVPSDQLLILPAGEKIVHVGFEGDSIVIENTEGTERLDMQVEYSFIQLVHVGVAVAQNFGVYKLTT